MLWRDNNGIGTSKDILAVSELILDISRHFGGVYLI